MSDTWCQMVWHQIADAGLHTYPVLSCVDVLCVPLTALRGYQCLSSLEKYSVIQELEGHYASYKWI